MSTVATTKNDNKNTQSFAEKILKHITDSIIVLDSNWNIVYLNKHAVQMFGGVHSLLGKSARGANIWDIIPEYKDSLSLRKYQDKLLAGKPVHFKMTTHDLKRCFTVDAFPAKDGIIIIFREFTQREKAEKALSQSEARFRAFFELNGAAMVSCDAATGRFLRVNSTFCRMTGYSAGELSEMTFSQITYYQERQKNWEDFTKARNNLSYYSTIKRYVRKNGEIFWARMHISFIPGTGGNALQTVGVVEDITQQKLIEEALTRSEKRFRKLIEKSSDVTVLLSEDGKRLYATPSIKKVLGYKASEDIGSSAYYAVHPDDVKRLKQLFKEGIDNPRKVITSQYRVKNKQGEYRWLEGTLTNLLHDQDIHAMVLNYHDISKSKKVEAELARSEERFRTLIQQSADALQLFDAKGKIIYTSDSIENILGYKPKEVQGKTGLAYLHPDDAQHFFDVFWELVRKPGKRVTLEYRLKHKNGSWVWVEATGVNHLENPVIRAIVGNFRDITQRKMLEQQKDEFMGMVSHELKTPVTSLKAFAQVLQQRFMKAGDENAAMLLGKMDGQINKLTTLIADLLDATKLESGKLQFHEDLFSFDEVVSEVVEEVQRTTARHTIITYGKTKNLLYGDKERVGQVLTNLLTNAIKYSPRAKKIFVEISSGKKEVMCCVQDFGIGIAKEKQEKVFERFFRESGLTENTFPGLGLGLYVSSEIVKRQGGKIWVVSKKGKGSTFCFTLPIRMKK